tara:strand:+ start:11 stop:367 length:357 start_codon:yes stop_codon:yes gene_type:complete
MARKSKSMKSKSVAKKSSSKKDCCDGFWESMNRNVVPWSLALLIGASVLLDLPVLRNNLSNGGGGLVGAPVDLSNFRRKTPPQYMGPQTMDGMGVKRVYFILAATLLLAVVMYLSVNN